MKFEVNFEDQYNEFLANISNMYYNENKTTVRNCQRV